MIIYMWLLRISFWELKEKYLILGRSLHKFKFFNESSELRCIWHGGWILHKLKDCERRKRLHQAYCSCLLLLRWQKNFCEWLIWKVSNINTRLYTVRISYGPFSSNQITITLFSHFSSNQIAITLFSLFLSNQITISIFSLQTVKKR